MEKISHRLREIAAADERKRNGQKISQHERQDLENTFILKYAKENNLWIEDIYSLGNPTGLRGHENTLVVDDINNVIYKSNNLSNAQFLISRFINQITAHNQLFPETKYELIGFTGIDNGHKRAPYIEVVLRQGLVKEAIQASPQEIADFMQSLGFTLLSESKFSNNEFTVSDLYPRNVLKDKNDIMYVVDDIVHRNHKI